MKHIYIVFFCLFKTFFLIGQHHACQLDSIVIYRFEWGKSDAFDKVEITPIDIFYKNILTKNAKASITNTTDLRDYFLCQTSEFYEELSNKKMNYPIRLKYSYQINIFIKDKEYKYLVSKTYDLNSEQNLSGHAEYIKAINNLFPIN